jgi:hypothetical protein
MVYAVQAHLLYATATTRNIRLGQAQSFIEGKEKWGQTTLQPSDDPDPNALDIGTRFVTRADQESVEDFLLGSAGVQPGSWVQVHPCPHDEVRGRCQVERRTVV